MAGKLLALGIFAAGTAAGAEVKVFVSHEIQEHLEQPGPQFEKETEHKPKSKGLEPG